MVRWFGLIALFVSFLGGEAAAQSTFERMITPGPLTAVHAKLEANCQSCHQSFSKEAQPAKCLACHKGIAADIRTRTGFHGKDAKARQQACKTCHDEHKDRGFAIVRLNRAQFDHRLTNYPLVGAHAAAKCTGCHAANAGFRGTPTTCASCHAADDPHKGQLGKACQTCHSVAGWKQLLPFDHAKTGFALLGKHASTTCVGCHAGQKWKGISAACASCHVRDDVHKGSRGAACASCHSPAGWKTVSFNHDRDTGFSLTGKHAAVTCAGCHGASNVTPKPPRACIGCHARDDSHKGRNGTDCVRCHSTASWKTSRFDHNRMTHFPIRGAHARVECAGCHKQPATAVRPPSDCAGCHASTDPHRGALGSKCSTCHNEDSWTQQVRFDHALTRFPLLGKHANITCAQCHADRSFASKGAQCTACHADDHHAGTLGKAPACNNCHTAAGWKLWTFDHDASTRFPLTGKHAGLICSACHTASAEPARTPRDCASCHRRDDIHRGGFGQDCARCHVTTSFALIKF